MSDFHHPDDVFDALRGPATPNELVGEAEAVALMTDTHLAAKGKPVPSRSRRARVATLIAVGVIGFGGVAAAGPGGFDIEDLDGVEELLAGVEQAPPDGVPPVDPPPDEVPPVDAPPDDVPPLDDAPPADVPRADEPLDEDPSVDEVFEVEPLDPDAVDNPDTAFDEQYCLPATTARR